MKVLKISWMLVAILTRERYRKLSIEYLSHFDKDYVK